MSFYGKENIMVINRIIGQTVNLMIENFHLNGNDTGQTVQT